MLLVLDTELVARVPRTDLDEEVSRLGSVVSDALDRRLLLSPTDIVINRVVLERLTVVVTATDECWLAVTDDVNVHEVLKATGRAPYRTVHCLYGRPSSLLPLLEPCTPLVEPGST
jgi:hypothetical protein